MGITNDHIKNAFNGFMHAYPEYAQDAQSIALSLYSEARRLSLPLNGDTLDAIADATRIHETTLADQYMAYQEISGLTEPCGKEMMLELRKYLPALEQMPMAPFIAQCVAQHELEQIRKASNGLTKDAEAYLADFAALTHLEKIAEIAREATLFGMLDEECVQLRDLVDEHFELFFDALGLDQIVVTGTSMARTQMEVTGSLAQLSAKQIQAVSPNSISDLVRLIPGVHAEGGGGEVASNIMVRGMPSGGQSKYTPIEEDGMPVQSTGYLTSSAQDVTFRMDLGIENLEFARGGSATMFGLGSPLGVFNNTSKKSGRDGEHTVKISSGQYNLYRVDFNTGGSIGDKWNFKVGGFARYDEGPLVSGSNSRGYQLKGNITRQITNGHIRFYFRTLDDNVQFYLPYLHQKQATGSDAVAAAIGNDGKEITSIYSTQMGNFALTNPNGTIIGRLADGVTAKGNAVMFEFAKLMGGWELKSKTRLAYVMVANPDGTWPGWNCEVPELCGTKPYTCGPNAPGFQCGPDTWELIKPCDEVLGAGILFNAGPYATNHPCSLANGRRYIALPGEPEPETAFDCIARAGTYGRYPRTGETLVAAVSPALNVDDGCNAGFLGPMRCSSSRWSSITTTRNRRADPRTGMRLSWRQRAMRARSSCWRSNRRARSARRSRAVLTTRATNPSCGS